MMRAFFSLLFLLTLTLGFGCAEQPIVVKHPSRQTSRPRQTLPPQNKPVARPQTPTPIAPLAQPVSPTTTTAVQTTSPGLTARPPTPLTPALNELRKNISQPDIAQALIENKISQAELEDASLNPTFNPVKDQILFKLAKIHQKNNELIRASEYYRALASQYPQSPLAAQANIALVSLQSANVTDAHVIGAILPLSGRNASLGQHVLNALRLGLEMNKPDAKFRIALFDSESNPEQAASGVDKLVRDDHAIAILGGFSAKEATAIAERAELYRVPYVGFSQKTGLTNLGENVFRNALTPEMQIDLLVQFAFDKLNAKKFAIMYPNDFYGVEFANIFWDHVLARGGQITAVQTYDPKETDFSENIQKLLGTYYVDARLDEYREREKQLKAARKNSTQPKNSREHWSEENALPPIVDFDAVFVPDTSRALGQILAFMKFNDVSKMNYLGTNLWNSPELPQRADDPNAGLYFVDAFDVSQGATPQNQGFFKDYFDAYNEAPTLVEIQVYEVAEILRSQLEAGVNSRDTLASNLRALGRFAGVTGELRMSNQRELERPLNIMTLDSGLIKKVE